MARTNPDGHMHASYAQCIHIYQTEFVTTMPRPWQAGLTKMLSSVFIAN